MNITDVTALTPYHNSTTLPSGDCFDCTNYSSFKDSRGRNLYTSQADCMVKNPKSCGHLDSVTFEIPSDSTVSNPGTSSGGPDNQHINPNASTGKGSFAKAAKLVK